MKTLKCYERETECQNLRHVAATKASSHNLSFTNHFYVVCVSFFCAGEKQATEKSVHRSFFTLEASFGTRAIKL